MVCLGALLNHHTPAIGAEPPLQSLQQANPAAQWAVDTVVETLKSCEHSGDAFLAHRVDEAMRYVKACIDAPDLPDETRAQLLEALSGFYLAQQNAPAALNAMREGVALLPTVTDRHWATLAMLYLANGRTNESLASLDHIRAAHQTAGDLDAIPDTASVYYLTLGTTLLAARNFPKAEIALGHGIRIQPGNASVYWYRGLAREFQGDTAAARLDYVRFARWALDLQIDPKIGAKLASLGIDPAQERRRPFGDENPLRERAQATLDTVRQAMSVARTTQEKALAYGALSVALDYVGQRREALAAIDRALLLTPDDARLKQSKMSTLLGLGRVDEVIRFGKPFSEQIDRLASSTAAPVTAYSDLAEAAQTLSRAYRAQGKWKASFDALAAYAKGAEVSEQDYAATTYLYLRAKAGSKAPANAELDAYIRSNTQQIPSSYRRGLLLYVQGKVPIEQVYWQAVLSGDAAFIQNALAETWFIAAAYQRYVKHDETAAQDYLRRLNDLQPYGTLEWDYAKNNEV
ncbi:hypothetical protein PIN31115_03526 [Pandoraea iniqua]|uniref:Beta-barrel assembly-enhancing protease n=2 Tax=Pandoraea iniqua TaxID=2508288 RepID=A0A5E4WYN8_9BURK|nr:hypothetical protein PIN31115_03526 [Pandoraea iniqua]